MIDQALDDIRSLRAKAADYEAGLDPARRKNLGQFFTGLRLGRVLAALSVDSGAKTVLDPMAGHGDLIDATLERAERYNWSLTRLDGVEVDPATAAACMRRLILWQKGTATAAVRILASDAFGAEAVAGYLPHGYDVVITNPPYVRYQSLAAETEGNVRLSPAEVRERLRALVHERTNERERHIWTALVDGYSGLADLSVPAWLLGAALVRPGGVLAIVAPATWRSRNYGDVIQYLLARCFQIEFVVEDTQPGWFSDALVRTQLVVARRLDPESAAIPLSARSPGRGQVVTARVSPSAGDTESLLGTAFSGPDPEEGFVEWMRGKSNESEPPRGVSRDVQPLSALTAAVLATVESKKWFQLVEPGRAAGPLFGEEHIGSALIPQPVRALLDDSQTPRTERPNEAGISISQGLRTGCNGFFYVDLVCREPDGKSRVRLSEWFGHEEIVIPFECVVPVLRGQADHERGTRLDVASVKGQALDLSGWVLPEDMPAVEAATHLYKRSGIPIPRSMPDALASYVRRAANIAYGSEANAKSIPDLSAVRTNVRLAGERPPRFWYMLPPFSRRHRPDVLIPRINQGSPVAMANSEPPVLIDANFSTLWIDSGMSARALCALLNSCWCRASMEALGTPLGGGALKLEATQLNQLPLPILTNADRQWLERAAGDPTAGTDVRAPIDRFVLSKVFPSMVDEDLQALESALRGLAETMCANRQKHSA